MKNLKIILLFLAAPLLTEGQSFRAVHYNPAGTDDDQEYIELVGTPNSTITGATILYVDGDASNAGIIKTIYALPTLTFGSNGLILLRDAATVLNPAPAAATTVHVQDFSPNLQNGTGNFLLVTGFTGVSGDDLDSDNDGVLNATLPWTSVLSAVSVQDDLTQTTDRMYAAALGGTNIAKPASPAAAPTGVLLVGGVWNAVITTGTGPYNVTQAWTNGSASNTLSNTILTPGTTAAPLPVTYTYFKGTAGDGLININWETSSEINASSFDIEKSVDAVEFFSIGNLKSVGNTDVKVAYQWQDKQPTVGINYYRLKQFDVNGVFEYSKIISIEYNDNLPLFMVLGNPIEGNEIKLFVRNLSTDAFSLHSSDGRAIDFEKYENQNNVVLLPKRILSGGLYYLSIKDGNRVITQKIIVR